MNGKPVINQLNNGVLSSTNAMPLKNTTSDNGESFAIDRALFQKAYQPPFNYALKQSTKSFFQRRTPGITNGFIVDGPKSANQKKWIGGNRDSSNSTMNRRIKSTGGIITTSGEKSFNNPRDNNPRIAALARVRGGGSSVPAKVSGRNMVSYYTNQPTIDPTSYYRIVSAGLNATSGSVIRANGSAKNVAPGFYKYTTSNSSVVTIANTTSGTFKRSYNVLTINRSTGVTYARNFDVFNNYNVINPQVIQATALANYLNALSDDVIVVISTFDEPQTYSTTGNNRLPLPADLIAAMKRCGASNDFGSSTGSPVGIINYRGSYVLVGIPGIGQDNGLQRYMGASVVNGSGDQIGDPSAFIDLRFSVINGQYTYISGR
jgi:hypothetical protein